MWKKRYNQKFWWYVGIFRLLNLLENMNQSESSFPFRQCGSKMIIIKFSIINFFSKCERSKDCNRDEIVNENGEIKTPLDHELDGQHPWHLENYPDIPNLHVM